MYNQGNNHWIGKKTITDEHSETGNVSVSGNDQEVWSDYNNTFELKVYTEAGVLICIITDWHRELGLFNYKKRTYAKVNWHKVRLWSINKCIGVNPPVKKTTIRRRAGQIEKRIEREVYE